MTQSSNNIAGTATLTTTWQRVLNRHRDAIQEVSDERSEGPGHGVWVYLRPGYACELGHQAHETSAAAMGRALAGIYRCGCPDCHGAQLGEDARQALATSTDPEVLDDHARRLREFSDQHQGFSHLGNLADHLVRARDLAEDTTPAGQLAAAQNAHTAAADMRRLGMISEATLAEAGQLVDRAEAAILTTPLGAQVDALQQAHEAQLGTAEQARQVAVKAWQDASQAHRDYRAGTCSLQELRAAESLKNGTHAALVREQDKLRDLERQIDALLALQTEQDRAEAATVKPLAPSADLGAQLAQAKQKAQQTRTQARLAQQAWEVGRMTRSEWQLAMNRKRAATRALREALKADRQARTRAKLAQQDEAAPACGHSACRQNWIDTGEGACVLPQDRAEAVTLEDATRQHQARVAALPVALEAALLLNLCGDAAAPVSTGRACQACWAAVRELAGLVGPLTLAAAVDGCSDPAEAQDALRDLLPQD